MRVAAELCHGHSGSLNRLCHLIVAFLLWRVEYNSSPEDPRGPPPRLAFPVCPAYAVFQ